MGTWTRLGRSGTTSRRNGTCTRARSESKSRRSPSREFDRGDPYRSRPNLIGCGRPIRRAPDLGGGFPAAVQVPRDIGAEGAVRLEPELAVGAQDRKSVV